MPDVINKWLQCSVLCEAQLKIINFNELCAKGSGTHTVTAADTYGAYVELSGTAGLLNKRTLNCLHKSMLCPDRRSLIIARDAMP